MLMLPQSGANGSGQVDISPYLVVFMAFVSGFMVKDAFNRIQDAGRKLFRGIWMAERPVQLSWMGRGKAGLPHSDARSSIAKSAALIQSEEGFSQYEVIYYLKN
tara:strand:+ start:220 stop:531 length:312 start_codon:yes stop_codon:yes gene_type:complete